MTWREKALTAIILAVVLLSLTMAPTWSMAFLILFGMIAPAVFAAGKEMRKNPALAVNAPVLSVDALALNVDALAHAVDAPALAVDAAGKMRRKAESSSTSSSSSGFKYDVYLRGLDTHKGFTDHLYLQLVDAGIRVIRDEYDLPPGKEIGLELKEALERSRISIAIFSKGYASSKRCLRELVLMWECRKTNGQTVIPIFYDVSPLDVMQMSRCFEESFILHEMDGVDLNTIKTWKRALRQIGGLSGYDLENNGGREGQLTKEVVAHVVQVLKDDQVVTDKLVGIDLHVEEMMRKLGVAYSEGQAIEVCGEEVHVVGVCGAPGVGKSTLAKVVYNKMRKLFDACSFLENISLEGVQFSRHKLIADLQKQKPAPLESSGEEIEEIARLCRNAKVLIVLDNVDEDEQIKELAGKLIWFGPGSRIIVTTNKRKVLSAFDVGAADHGMVEEHTVKPMDHGQALQLFCKHVFQGAAAQDSEYFGLSVDIVKAIGGDPSAIVLYALFLRDMNIDIWKTTLDLLKKRPKDR